MDINKKPIYPVETWNVTEKEFSMETNYRNETTFALSNGYIGTRGTFEEGYDFSVDEGLEGNLSTDFMKVWTFLTESGIMDFRPRASHF